MFDDVVSSSNQPHHNHSSSIVPHQWMTEWSLWQHSCSMNLWLQSVLISCDSIWSAALILLYHLYSFRTIKYNVKFYKQQTLGEKLLLLQIRMKSIVYFVIWIPFKKYWGCVHNLQSYAGNWKTDTHTYTQTQRDSHVKMVCEKLY